MIPELRRNKILDILNTTKVEHLDNLSSLIGISESTLRRDLKELSQNGAVEMLRGGGVRLKTNNAERGIAEKILTNREEKERIAKAAAAYIKDDDVIFLDPSSLNYIMVSYIQARNIKCVTNSISIINELIEHGIPSMLIGGEVKVSTSSCVGPSATEMLQDLRFSKCFIGANGLSVKMGITSHDGRERLIKQMAIRNSIFAYFLVDSYKHNEVAMQKIADIDEYPVITGKYFDDYENYENIIVV